MIESEPTSTQTTGELKALYKKWPDVKRYLRSMGCPSSDAEDIFQEALLIFTRKKEQPDFVLTVEPFHYVKNTCKFLWYNESRKRGKTPTVEIESAQLEDEQSDEWLQRELQLQVIEKAISKIGAKCKELLQLFYGKGWSMVDIARKIGLRNDKVAKAQKYRCLNKAKDEVRAMESQISMHQNEQP